MIRRLYIDNYKCLQNVELEFGQVCILMGRNGSGKSAVFEVLHALQQIICQDARPSDYFNEATQTKWDGRRAQTVELTLETPDAPPDSNVYTYRLQVEHDPARGEPRVLNETLHFAGKRLFAFEQGEMHLYRDNGSPGPTFPGDWRRSGLARVVPGKDNGRLIWFKEWMSRVIAARPNPAMILGRAPEEAPMLMPDLSNFASWYRHLAQASPRMVYEAISEMAQVFPGFNDMGVRVDEQRVGWLRANLKAPGASDYALSFEQLSDGQRVLFALQVILAHHAQGEHPVALDEPDNYLALAEVQPLLMRALDTALGGGGQLLVISHHPEFLNQLAPSHGLVFYRDGGGPTRVKPLSPAHGAVVPELRRVGVLPR
jgi:ABC-type cobalamin/Fe3+-siderophores transport system ATPase subunit